MQDNDEQVTSAELSLSDEQIAEGETSAAGDGYRYPRRRDFGRPIDRPVPGGTATADDYSVEGPRVIEIEPGEQIAKHLNLAPIDDALEDEETAPAAPLAS